MLAPSRPRWRGWADASSARHLVLRLRWRLDTARACASSRQVPAEDRRLRYVPSTSQTFPRHFLGNFRPMLVFNAETVAVLMGMLPPLRRRGHSPDTSQHSQTLSRHVADPRRPQPRVGRGAPQARHFLDTSQTGPRPFLGCEPLYPAWPPARAALGASLPRRLLPRWRQARRPRPPLRHHGLSLPV